MEKKKNFSYGAPTKNTPLWGFVSYKPPRETRLGSLCISTKYAQKKIYVKFCTLFKICTITVLILLLVKKVGYFCY